MKKHLLLITMSFVVLIGAYSQNISWNQLKSVSAEQKTLLKSTENEIEVAFNISEFGLQEIATPNGLENILHLKKGAFIQKKGAPDLSLISGSVIIPNTGKTKLEIVDAQFVEYDNIDVAPSKGVVTRDKKISEIPFEYGEEYSKDAFFPSQTAELRDPYILRDFRAQAIVVYPLQYNPVQKKLRVYTSITVKVVQINEQGINELTKTKANSEIDTNFDQVYRNHFINYKTKKYTPLAETGGKMLIITYDSFADEMQDFVDWKNAVGVETEMVNYSTIGSSSALKNYVANYYNTNGLTFLLLVGDHAQVPASSTSAGYSDNNYGYIAGNDHYLDIFVGRFSAENGTQVTTQVNRTIYYERDMPNSSNVLTKGIGIASNEGAGGGGDNGESDEQHMNNIENDLEGYGYTITRNYQNGGSTSQMTSLMNNGAGIVNYVGHGSTTSWAAPSFTNTNVNALTNVNKYPFIISVACVVGNFTSNTCFAETWLRATSGGTPTGALVFCGSTINQSWASPMRAQDEMNDLLVADSYYRYGGMFVNGMFAMIDAYGTDGENMADTWTIFGDPSVYMRTPGHPDALQSSESCGTPASLSATNITETSARLNWGSVSDAVSYTVQYKAVSSSSWNSQTTSNTYLNISSLSMATNYEFKVMATCSEGGSAYSAAQTFTTAGTTYCDSYGNDFSYEWISKVAFGSYNKSSSGAAYTDFTSEIVQLEKGIATNVTFTPGFSGQAYQEYWAVYIDFNGDKDFEDAGELVFSANGTSAVSGTITIPTSASGSTRMRVIMKYDSAPTPCGSYSYGETEDYTVEFVEGQITYCDAYGTNQNYEWIAGVSIGSFTNNTSKSQYSDFTSQIINVNAGGSYNVTLTPQFASSSYNEYWKIWVDFNEDGDFDDANEELFSGSGSSTVTGNITIPSDVSGNKRLRVVMNYNSSISSCGSFTYGEVEDYTISIARSRETEEHDIINSISASIYPNPNNGNFTVQLNGYENSMVELKLFSSNGQQVSSSKVFVETEELKHSLSFDKLVSGMYYMIISDGQTSETHKLVIQ